MKFVKSIEFQWSIDRFDNCLFYTNLTSDIWWAKCPDVFLNWQRLNPEKEIVKSLLFQWQFFYFMRFLKQFCRTVKCNKIMSHSYKISQFHICWWKSNLNFCFGSLSKQFKTRISLFPSLTHCGKRLFLSDFNKFLIKNCETKFFRL